jgi:ubiquinone/menaquinone biosynthesis C-methylase UbiE
MRIALLLLLFVARQEPAHDHASPERIAAILAALSARAGSVVADVGAGGGDYSVKIARAVSPSGRVLSVDISDEALARLKARVAAEGLRNVEAIKGAVDNPNLPAGSIDGALIVNAYHEMTEYQAMLRAIHAALKPGGRLVMIEPITAAARVRSRDDQAWRHQIAPELVLREVREAGFEIIALEDPFKAGAHHPGQDEWLLIAVARHPAGSNR